MTKSLSVIANWREDSADRGLCIYNGDLKLSKEKLLGSDRAYVTSGLLLVVAAILSDSS